MYVETYNGFFKLRKRKREIYEEEDSDVGEEKSDAENDLDVTDLMWGLGDGGPQGAKGDSLIEVFVGSWAQNKVDILHIYIEGYLIEAIVCRVHEPCLVVGFI